jgi:hypothetical protein
MRSVEVELISRRGFDVISGLIMDFFIVCYEVFFSKPLSSMAAMLRGCTSNSSKLTLRILTQSRIFATSENGTFIEEVLLLADNIEKILALFLASLMHQTNWWPKKCESCPRRLTGAPCQLQSI